MDPGMLLIGVSSVIIIVLLKNKSTFE